MTQSDASSSSTSSSPDSSKPVNGIIVARPQGVTTFAQEELVSVMQMPLPGIKIFVHGVNSDGEWYEQAEEGLCKGLNTRLARCDEHLTFTGPEAGQLSPSKYIDELTPDGFINPKMNSKTFVSQDGSFSPVIRFRWGYKAAGEELQLFGKGLYLNEQNYWGGGPFANGCTTLPDLWGKGIEDELFMFLHIQHLNPTNDRKVYAAPPRPYYVFAAYRLAKLVESIRKKQADVPITIICHSQGNMIGICAAFLGDAMPDVSDGTNTGRCVADTYILCNAPYSLLEKNSAENWAERHMLDKAGRRGRQTLHARAQTLANFFYIIKNQQSCEQDVKRIDMRMANKNYHFNAADDKKSYGHGSTPSTYGRVTLYCNPHDQVISATTVQGIGWRGMSRDELKATGLPVNFCQRVFAQGFMVGDETLKEYDYWKNHWNYSNIQKYGKDAFWYPPSPSAGYSIRKGLDADAQDYGDPPKKSISFGQIFTFGLAPFLILGLKIVNMKINGLPEDVWTLPLSAPKLPVPFMPVAVRLGQASESFDQGYDAPSDYVDMNRPCKADDPLMSSGAPQGNAKSEASLQYDTHATLRLMAKRDDLYASDAKVEAEDDPANASEDYKKWRDKKVRTILAENIDTHATDHSTIVTNSMHADLAMAYDVAVGVCDIKYEDLFNLRKAADWRFVAGLPKDDDNKKFKEYFESGKFSNISCFDWANTSVEGAMPESILDERDGGILLSVGKFI